MNLTPEDIFQKYQNEELDRKTSINFLIFLIENSNDETMRVESLKTIGKIQTFDDELYEFIENLLISDSNLDIRCHTAEIIRAYYGEKSLSLLTWVLKHEKSIECLAIIVKTLIEIDTPDSKNLLFEEVEKIKKLKQLHVGSIVSTNHFRKQIKELFRKNKKKDVSSVVLGEVLLNFWTLLGIKKTFFSVYYELVNSRVVTLDLSDVEFEVRGWKAEYKNNITQLSEIPGLHHLTSLERLYLSNNKISDVEGLEELLNLSYVDVSNNKIEYVKNLDIFKALPRLKHVKLNGNPIVNKINFHELNKTIDIKFETKSDFFK